MSTAAQTTHPLMAAIENKTATIGIVGLGYVGLPLVQAFMNAGYRTMGFDVDQSKVEKLLRGKSYIAHITGEWIAECIAERKFEPTADMARLSEPDAILICVPTPLSDSRDPDLTYVETTTRQVAKVLRPGQIVVLESTTYPGTTRDVMLPILCESGLRSGEDFFLAYSPEREDPGNTDFSAAGIPKVVGGDRSAWVWNWPTPCTAGRRPHGTCVQLRGGRSVQDPRKHLPLRQYRHGQRAEGAVRSYRDRRLGGDRGGQDQAVRVSGVLSRSGTRWTLHPDRSVLSQLGRTQARHADPVHRIGRRNQRVDAPLCRQPDGRGAQRCRQAGARQPDRDPGRGL